MFIHVSVTLQAANAVLESIDQTSDLEGSDDDDFDPATVAANNETDNSEEVSDNDGEASDSESDDHTAGQLRKNKQKKSQWRKKSFTSNMVTECTDDTFNNRSTWKPSDYFHQYIQDELFATACVCTNRKTVAETGRNLKTTSAEMKQFFGITVLSSCLGYPRLRMYWARDTRVARIADTMSRDRYFKIRNNLKLVTDSDISDDEKTADRLWRVRPILDSVLRGCHLMFRSSHVSIDEQMIPFSGQVAMKQFVRGKPNPVGLKNFVAANPDGLMLDFRIYVGSETFRDVQSELGLAAKAVLCLSGTLPRGSVIYCDRYFTSIGLAEALLGHGIMCTGTVMKNRVSSISKNLPSDSDMKTEGRGACDEVVSPNSNIVLVKWYDNKPITLLSTATGKTPEGECTRWSKAERKRVPVKCPAAVMAYNAKMGGVDMNDRLISFYRIKSRSKKWTVRTVMHFIDVVCANSWIQYKNDRTSLGDRKKDIQQFLQFKLDIAEYLLSLADAAAETSDEEATEADRGEGSSSKRPRITPMPSDNRRLDGRSHLPVMLEGNINNRCRKPGCKLRSKIMCETCEVFLCIKSNTNCFKDFHQK